MMKDKKRKMAAFLAAVLMVALCLCQAAFAAESAGITEAFKGAGVSFADMMREEGMHGDDIKAASRAGIVLLAVKRKQCI